MAELKIKRNLRIARNRAKRLLRAAGFTVLEVKEHVDFVALGRKTTLLIKVQYESYWDELVLRLEEFARTFLPKNVYLELWIYFPNQRDPGIKIIWPPQARSEEMEKILQKSKRF